MPQAMTEEVARSRWCPFARVAEPVEGKLDNEFGAAAVNRPQQGVRPNCIGGQCACWGWADDPRGQTVQRWVGADAAINKPKGQGRMPAGELMVDWWPITSANEADLALALENHRSFQIAEIVGPPRGRCEAASPYVEVNHG